MLASAHLVGDLLWDELRRSLTRNGKKVYLSCSESILFVSLYQSRLLLHAELSSLLARRLDREPGHPPAFNAPKHCVRRLRNKLTDLASDVRVVNVFGRGYCLVYRSSREETLTPV